MSTNSEHIAGRAGPSGTQARSLHSVAQTRALEASGSTASAPSLMQQAGLALARLTLAVAPHAKTIWIACGPGNNGGDGLEAAAHLQQWGKQVVVSLLHDPEHGPSDARQAWQAARIAGVQCTDAAPPLFDVCIDALFGIGALRPLTGTYAEWVLQMNTAKAPTIAVDIPSGLNADTGALADIHVVAHHTLSLLTLKPGLFTGGGRDASGEIWFNDLNVPSGEDAQARLLAAPAPLPRLHASHKGTYGDVCVLGGASGMRGAALLAAQSALNGGSGRVFVCPLGDGQLTLDTAQPELMFRRFEDLDWHGMTLVAGCGGGQAIAEHLPTVLQQAHKLVLDADALNRIAESPAWQTALTRRATGSTVLTPHPLEAARLLSTTAAHIQSDRPGAAQALADRYQCVVVLKGSGTVVAAPGATLRINPTGNAKLATAGTGDVLAGLIGAHLASGAEALEAASAAVYQHGLAADRWQGTVLTASALCQWQ